MKSFKHYFIRNFIRYTFCAIVSIATTVITSVRTLNAGLALGVLLSEVLVAIGAAIVALIEERHDHNR